MNGGQLKTKATARDAVRRHVSDDDLASYQDQREQDRDAAIEQVDRVLVHIGGAV